MKSGDSGRPRTELDGRSRNLFGNFYTSGREVELGRPTLDIGIGVATSKSVLGFNSEKFDLQPVIVGVTNFECPTSGGTDYVSSSIGRNDPTVILDPGPWFTRYRRHLEIEQEVSLGIQVEPNTRLVIHSKDYGRLIVETSTYNSEEVTAHPVEAASYPFGSLSALLL